ncbi:MAG: DNA gyrase/topoisomerase IV subunit A [Bacteroidia bacterium]|nr:DNA gyrase/topoisomerase IV subunit A [Bacteroidia bacterium]
MAENTNGVSSHPEEATTPVKGMYENYFLDYASYVILERAVPLLDDGFKPVQRRILHAMKEMDDGRFHKVANIIGQTMQYHPHGDAAIGDALVKLGQKDLLVDCQGNWGDFRTGDNAAAPRYIEAKLSKFALEVSYNSKITEWQASYDGRKKEPLALPVKFPMVLAMGVEGIAVGLSTKILPHNFIELCEASIEVLKGNTVQVFPDFATGGKADVSNYQGGKRGGKVRMRATIDIKDKNTLLVKDVPYGVTTSSLIDSIVKANDKGKIKIKKVTDNTAKVVEIQVDLPSGISPDIAIDALYAFTDCEVSISPNACIIIGEKPVFLTVEEILDLSTRHTKELLRKELEIKLAELKEKLLFSSLEKIFIENRIYRDIEEAETWEDVIATIDRGLDPYKPQFFREITEDDIVRLTEIRIKRISKFNKFKADEIIKSLEDEIAEVTRNLKHLVEYAIDYFKMLIEKFGKGRERKTEIQTFDNIQVTRVAVANEKLYVNRKEGFVGYGLKKDEYVKDCSDIDDIIVFRRDGKYRVFKVQDKVFVGKDIIYVDVWKKGQERKIYHAIYRDPKSGNNYVKRFAVTAITRDKDYDVTTGEDGAKVVYFSVHENSESEVVTVNLSQSCRAKIKTFDYDFSELAIKGRNSRGNVLTKYPIRRIKQKHIGSSTLGGRKIWLDETIGRLNTDQRGRFLGEFDTEDSILVVYKDGSYEQTNFELTNRYEMNKSILIEKFDPETVINVVHYDGEKKDFYVKRFKVETTTMDTKFSFIGESSGSKLILASTHPKTTVLFKAGTKTKDPEDMAVVIGEFIDVKGWRAIGNKLDRRIVTDVKMKDLPKEESSAELKAGDKVSWTGDDVKDNGAQGNLF